MLSVERKIALFKNCVLTIIIGLFHFNAHAAVCDVDDNNVIDRIDIGLITNAAMNSQTAAADDPRDFDGDGKITIVDARLCVFSCKLAGCTPVSPGNNAQPVANAGSDQTVFVNQSITLNGSASIDTDGDELSYRWSLIAPTDSSALLSDSEVVNPTLFIDVPGTYQVELVVNDGIVDSLPDTKVIDTANSAPVADAGSDQATSIGETVTLDGSGSNDVDSDPLSFLWTLTPPTGSVAVLNDSSLVNPAFTVDEPGTYSAKLVVNDGNKNSEADSVSIITGNTAPVANAGIDQSVFLGDSVSLDGSASSDVDSDSLTFVWSITSAPDGSLALLSDASAAKPVFTIDVPGTYIIQLIVNDGKRDSIADTVTITTENSVPQAKAGPDQSVLLGEKVTLDGSNSIDVDDDSLTYRWSLIKKPDASNATLDNANAIQAEFTLDIKGTYIAQLIVNDGIQDSLPDTVIITTGNSSPVAFAGSDLAAIVGATVSLDGSGSNDADGDALSYSWSIISIPEGSAAILSDSQATSPNFIADVAGTYIIQLLVNDGFGDSAPDSIVTIVEEASELTVTPQNLQLLTSDSSEITVSLPAPAGPGGIVLNLVSDNPAVASVPSSVSIPEGSNSVQVAISSELSGGIADITVSGAGYATAKLAVNVNKRTFEVLLAGFGGLVGVDRALQGSILLEKPAPEEGVTISLSNNATNIASVTPETVNIAAGKSQANIFISGAALGKATLAASAKGYKSTEKEVTVTDSVINIGVISKVIPGQSSNFTIQLSHPAPAGGLSYFF